MRAMFQASRVPGADDQWYVADNVYGSILHVRREDGAYYAARTADEAEAREWAAAANQRAEQGVAQEPPPVALLDE